MEKPPAGKVLLDDTVPLTAQIEASQSLHSHTVRAAGRAAALGWGGRRRAEPGGSGAGGSGGVRLRRGGAGCGAVSRRGAARWSAEGRSSAVPPPPGPACRRLGAALRGFCLPPGSARALTRRGRCWGSAVPRPSSTRREASHRPRSPLSSGSVTAFGSSDGSRPPRFGSRGEVAPRWVAPCRMSARCRRAPRVAVPARRQELPGASHGRPGCLQAAFASAALPERAPTTRVSLSPARGCFPL